VLLGSAAHAAPATLQRGLPAGKAIQHWHGQTPYWSWNRCEPLAYQSPSPANRDSSNPLVSNERVTVTDVTWVAGQPSSRGARTEDTVTVYLKGGTLKTMKNGGTTTTLHPTSSVTFAAKGDDESQEAVGADVRAIVIRLHDGTVPPLPNTSDNPEAFPRTGSRKLLENGRVIVWEYTFMAGSPTPLHFHSRDVVTVYTDDGAVKSTTLDGESVVDEHHPGEAKFNPRNRIHTEELARGAVHLIAVELK
jgi:hypothetical protein